MIHLRGHSTFSMLEAIGLLPPLLDQTKKLGMSAIGLTEYYFFSGALQFYQKATKVNIKPIIGIELGFIENITLLTQTHHIGNITLIAKNYDGYQNLLKISSIAQKHKKNDIPVIDFTLLAPYISNIYLLRGSAQSHIGMLVQQGVDYDHIQSIRDRSQQLFGKNFLADLIAQDYTKEPQLQKINDTIHHLSEQFHTPLLIHNNFHYIHKEDKEAYEIALAIKDGNKMYDNNRRKVKGDYHLMTGKEITDIMLHNGYDKNDITKMIQTNMDIASTIDIKIPLRQSLFPKYETPPNIQKLYEKYKKELVEKQ